MSEILYRKVNGRYIPHDSESFHSDGIWWVRNDTKSGTRIAKLGEKPSLYPFVNIVAHSDRLTDYILNLSKEKEFSIHELSLTILEFLEKRIEEEDEVIKEIRKEIKTRKKSIHVK